MSERISTWPPADQYRSWLDAGGVFAAPSLRDSTPHRTRQGLLFYAPGADAVVFRLNHPDGRSWAVRCFTRWQAELPTRYDALARHLESCPVEGLLTAEYQPHGLQAFGLRLPVLIMDWVEGLSLDQWLEVPLEESDTEAIAGLEAGWLALLDRLAAAQIAHGDLHPSNIVVSAAGELHLIDYDSIMIPALAEQPTNIVGKPNFIHPERLAGRSDAGWYGPDMDRFSGWLVLIALRALRCRPELVEEWPVDADHLLFDQDDLHAPDDTALWHDLRAIDDPELQGWLDQFAEACRSSIHDTPPLPRLAPVPPADDDPLAAWRARAERFRAQHPDRVARPARDPYTAFHAAVDANHLAAALTLWPTVRELDEVASFADAFEHQITTLRGRWPGGGAAPDPADALAVLLQNPDVLSRREVVAALQIWETVRHRPEAGQFAETIATLRQRATEAPAGEGRSG